MLAFQISFKECWLHTHGKAPEPLTQWCKRSITILIHRSIMEWGPSAHKRVTAEMSMTTPLMVQIQENCYISDRSLRLLWEAVSYIGPILSYWKLFPWREKLAQPSLLHNGTPAVCIPKCQMRSLLLPMQLLCEREKWSNHRVNTVRPTALFSVVSTVEINTVLV